MTSDDWGWSLLGVTRALSEQRPWDDLLRKPKPYTHINKTSIQMVPSIFHTLTTQWTYNLHLHFWGFHLPLYRWDSLRSTHLHQPHWKPWPAAGCCRCLGLFVTQGSLGKRNMLLQDLSRQLNPTFVRHGCHLLVIKTLRIDAVWKYLSIDKIQPIGWYVWIYHLNPIYIQGQIPEPSVLHNSHTSPWLRVGLVQPHHHICMHHTDQMASVPWFENPSGCLIAPPSYPLDFPIPISYWWLHAMRNKGAAVCHTWNT